MDRTALSEELIARYLRLAVITDQWRHGRLTEEQARELLAGPLSPGDDTTIRDDAALLGDPDAFAKLTAQVKGEST